MGQGLGRFDATVGNGIWSRWLLQILRPSSAALRRRALADAIRARAIALCHEVPLQPAAANTDATTRDSRHHQLESEPTA